MSGFSLFSPSIHTSQPSVAALESLEASSLLGGELAVVLATGQYYYLDRSSVQPRNGVDVLYTRNTNPQFQPTATVATPGRWIKACLVCGTGSGPLG